MSAVTADGSQAPHPGFGEGDGTGSDAVEVDAQMTLETSPNGLQPASNGYAGGNKWGKEPAVKQCGFMTIPTLTKTVTVLMALASVGRVWLLHYDRATGKLCSPSDENACVTLKVSLVLISIARFTAGALFPSITFCILSKCYATRYFLHHSWLSLIVDLEPTHNLHTYFGCVTLICSVIHGLAHIARYVYEQDPGVMLQTDVNRSGLAALLLMILSVAPMALRYFIARWTFEVRKTIHMLFVPMLMAICFHTTSLKYMGAFFLVWYLADRLYYTTRQTFFISRPKYKTIGRGTLVRFDLPSGYKFKAGAYIQVNCPAISSSEWHPFSLFPVPGRGTKAGFHVEAVGDWTQELFRLSLEDPRMPLWISAAQPSVLENAMYYENVILVCTGAGITPAVSIAHRFSQKKNVHLMWMSRDAGMVAMFEKQLRSVKSTVHLTGKQPEKTKERMMTLLAPPENEVVTSEPPSRRSSLVLSSTGSPVISKANVHAVNTGAQQLQNSGVEEGQHLGSEDRQQTYNVELSLGTPVFEWPQDLSIEEEGNQTTSGDQKDEREATDIGGNMVWSGGDTSQSPPVRPSRRASSKTPRSRGQHPVSVKFGRPDIEGFITGTIQARQSLLSGLSSKLLPCPRNDRNVHLNSGQRISKEDLMMADMSVMEEGMKKTSGIFNIGSAAVTAPSSPGGIVPPKVSTASWVVLYCGANARVERALISACNEHGVAWRKEYFSAW